jgi:hypothetical protein
MGSGRSRPMTDYVIRDTDSKFIEKILKDLHKKPGYKKNWRNRLFFENQQEKRDSTVTVT